MVKRLLRHANDERGVVEVAGRASFQEGRCGLEELSVQPDGMAPGTKRKPIQIDAHLTYPDSTFTRGHP
jgi:hypothetical protein